MESASKRLRKKKEFSGLHPSLWVKKKKTNGFSNSAPFSPLFPTEITRQFPQNANAGPWTFQPGFAYTKIFACNYL